MSSSKPKLYYIPYSPPSRSVLLVAKAIGLDLELQIVNLLTKEQLQPWFLALNPQHTLPTLDDGAGRVLWDSHAISTYLIGQYGGSDDHPLYPRDLYTRALIDQRLHFESVVLFRGAQDLFRHILYGSGIAATEQHIRQAHTAYQLLETFLLRSPYVAGNHRTVADLSIITTLTQYATQIPLDAALFPNTVAWIARLSGELPDFEEMNTLPVRDFVELYNGVVAKNKEKLAAQ